MDKLKKAEILLLGLCIDVTFCIYMLLCTSFRNFGIDLLFFVV
jgi:hypothetical protein